MFGRRVPALGVSFLGVSVLAALSLSALPALAQDNQPLYGEVDLQGGFLPDPWTRDLLAGGDRWAGEIDPACAGYVNSGPPDLRLHFSEPQTALHLSLSAYEPVSLMIRLPNGAWQCSGPTETIARVTLGKPIPGSYEIWTGAEGGFPDARLFISELSLSDDDLRFTGAVAEAELPPLGEARLHLAAQELPLDGSITSLDLLAGGPDAAGSFAADYCAGSIQADSPNLTLTLDRSVEELSLYARSASDTALVVLAPNGVWHCDDDSFGLNPAVTLYDAGPGEITVWVAVWGGGEADATLHLRAGQPRWEVDGRLSTVSDARLGSFLFDPKEPLPFSLELTAGGPDSVSEMAPGCSGHIDAETADLFLEVPQGVETLSLYATADGDLTLVVVDPEGELHCNDDSWGLHPAVTLTEPPAGSYSVWVGNWSLGSLPATFFAAAGEPDWAAALPEETIGDTGDYESEPGEWAFVSEEMLDGSVTSWSVTAGGPDFASGFDDRCVGNLDADYPDLVLELDRAVGELSLYVTAEADTALAVQAPDGSWHCNDDSYGLNPAVTLNDVGPGEISVWVSLWGSGIAPATLRLRAGEPLWQIDSALGEVTESRNGVLTVGPQIGPEPLTLALQAGGETAAYDFAPSCSGRIDPAAADLFVEVEEGVETLSLYATSTGDLTLLVLRPDGSVVCDDDSYELHPAVTLGNPEPGRYAVWVGSWGMDREAANFFAALGAPQWETAVPRLDLEGLSLLESLQAALAYQGAEDEFSFGRAEEHADGSLELFDLLLGPPHDQVPVARMLIRELDVQSFAAQRLPSVMDIEIDGMDLTGSLPEDEMQELLFGEDPAVVDAIIVYRYDAAAGRGGFERVMVRIPGKAEIDMKLTLLGTPPQPEDLMFGFLGPDQLDLRLEEAMLSVHDSGLLRRILEIGAAEEQTSVEALVEVGLAEMAKELSGMGLGEHPAAQALLEAVSAFARENQKPRRLSVSFVPAAPLDAGAVFEGMIDPAGLWDRLGVTVDYAAD